MIKEMVKDGVEEERKMEGNKINERSPSGPGEQEEELESWSLINRHPGE